MDCRGLPSDHKLLAGPRIRRLGGRLIAPPLPISLSMPLPSQTPKAYAMTAKILCRPAAVARPRAQCHLVTPQLRGSGLGVASFRRHCRNLNFPSRSPCIPDLLGANEARTRERRSASASVGYFSLPTRRLIGASSLGRALHHRIGKSRHLSPLDWPTPQMAAPPAAAGVLIPTELQNVSPRALEVGRGGGQGARPAVVTAAAGAGPAARPPACCHLLLSPVPLATPTYQATCQPFL